ncbi:MAG: DNRLRE domain-containing protein [Thermodesulfobacteriota bacterium]
MRKLFLVTIFVLFSSTALLITSVTKEVSALTYTIAPVDIGNPDSRSPDTVLGGQVGVWNYSYGEHRGYMKYDLSGISNLEVITSMVLTAKKWSGSQYHSPFWIDIHHVSDDSWDEASLTCNNKPDFNDLLGSVEFTNTLMTQWDLSAYDYSTDLLDGNLSMVMVSRDPVGTGITFRPPVLVIDTTPPKSCPNYVMDNWLIMNFGLILNLIGSLMIAFSIGKNPEGAYQGDKIYLASILYPKMFWCGVIILILGFAVSILVNIFVGGCALIETSS